VCVRVLCVCVCVLCVCVYVNMYVCVCMCACVCVCMYVCIYRPLFVEVPYEESTYDVEDEFFLGNALLIHPIVEANNPTVSVYLPGTHVCMCDV